jgi:hypothetical protein
LSASSPSPPLPPPPDQAPPPPEAPGEVMTPRQLRHRRVGRGLAATAWLGILGQPILLLLYAMQIAEVGAAGDPEGTLWVGWSMTAAALLGFLVALYALRAGRRLRHEGSTREARFAALFLVVPCSSPCLPLGLPVGLWALWALRDDD